MTRSHSRGLTRVASGHPAAPPPIGRARVWSMPTPLRSTRIRRMPVQSGFISRRALTAPAGFAHVWHALMASLAQVLALVRLPLALSLMLALAPAGKAGATDLLQAWQAAQAHDPALAAARAAQAAGQARADQATSLWRPTLEAQASVGRAAQDSQTRGARFSAPGFGSVEKADFDTSIDSGTRTEWGLQLRQPLIDLGRDAEAGRLRHSAAQAEAAWDAARQQAALRVAQGYFDVLLAQHGRQVLEIQRQAITRLLGEARTRFRVGDGSSLDIHEAEARLGLIEAQVRQADTRLDLARTVFQDLTGLPADALAPLRRNTPTLTARPDQSLSTWLRQVDEASPEIRQSMEAAAMAASQAEGLRAIAQPTLNLVGTAGRSHLSGSGDFGSAAQTGSQWMVGLELRIPLYTGGMRDARLREALAQRDGARYQAASARQHAGQLARAAWLNLDSGGARVQALHQALQASAARRDATHLGVEVGERTTLDRLDAERDFAQASLDLQQALTELALDRLRLQALAGSLDQPSMEAVNQALAASRATSQDAVPPEAPGGTGKRPLTRNTHRPTGDTP